MTNRFEQLLRTRRWSRYLNHLHTTMQRVMTSRWRVIFPVIRDRPVPCSRGHVSTCRRSKDLHCTRKPRHCNSTTYITRRTLRCRFWWRIKDIFEATWFASNVVRPTRGSTTHSRWFSAKCRRCYYRRVIVNHDWRERNTARTNKRSFYIRSQCNLWPTSCDKRQVCMRWHCPITFVKQTFGTNAVPLHNEWRIDACKTWRKTDLINSRDWQLRKSGRFQFTQTCIARLLGWRACWCRFFRYRTWLRKIQLCKSSRRRVKGQNSRHAVCSMYVRAKLMYCRRHRTQQVNCTRSFDVVCCRTSVLWRFCLGTTATQQMFVFQQLAEKVEVRRYRRSFLFYVPAAVTTSQTPVYNT